MTVRMLFAVMVLLLLHAPAHAQSDPCLRRTITVSVLDKNGEPITGLTAADFRAEFRGKPVRILSVAPRMRPVRIVVILDRSGSMGAEAQRWGVSVEAVAHLYATMPTEVSLALILFGDTVESRSNWGDDRNAVVGALLQMAHEPKEGKGNTVFYDAILAAIDSLPTPAPGDVIYAVTDGVDTNSRSDRSAVEQRLLQSGVRLFAFAPDRFRIQSEPDNLDPILLLSRLVQNTGGTLFPQKVKPDRRVTEANRLYKHMLTALALEIELDAPPDKTREWKLRLANDPELKRSQIAYPRKLLSCSSLKQP
jgi:hypothetical protein